MEDKRGDQESARPSPDATIGNGDIDGNSNPAGPGSKAVTPNEIDAQSFSTGVLREPVPVIGQLSPLKSSDLSSREFIAPVSDTGGVGEETGALAPSEDDAKPDFLNSSSRISAQGTQSQIMSSSAMQPSAPHTQTIGDPDTVIGRHPRRDQ